MEAFIQDARFNLPTTTKLAAFFIFALLYSSETLRFFDFGFGVSSTFNAATSLDIPFASVPFFNLADDLAPKM